MIVAVTPLASIAGHEIKGLLGTAGLTETYRARGGRGAGTRSVAIKLLRLERLPAEARGLATARFLAAGRSAMAAMVGGTGRVIEVGEDAAGPFIVSELVPGIDLTNLLKLARKRGAKAPGLEPTLAAAICAQVARVLTSAHESTPPLHHLGLGPNCVRVTPVAGVMVVDFGVAAALRGLGEQKISSWYFLPPELLAADAAEGFEGSGQAADVYSLGALLYFLLAGRPPVEAESLTRLLDRVWEPLPVLPGVPDYLARAIRRLTAPEPEKRPVSAREAAELLSEGMASPQERHQHIATSLRRLGIEERAKKSAGPSEPSPAEPSARGPAVPESAPAPAAPSSPAPARREEAPVQRSARRSQWRWRLTLAGAGILGLAAGWAILAALRHPDGGEAGGASGETRAQARAAPPVAISHEEIPASYHADGGASAIPSSPDNVVYRPMPKHKLPRVPEHLDIDTTPTGADIWVDGVLRGKTPANVVIGRGGHRVVLLKEGFRMDRAVYNGDEGEWIRIPLMAVDRLPRGEGVVGVRCRGTARYPILVDGEETGLLCPAGAVPVIPGKHKIAVFVPVRRGVVETDVEVPPGRRPVSVTLSD
jgi:serine/threonine protein kinase